MLGSSELHDFPRFLVVQYGARHGYAIPAAFERAEALAGVYTDFTASHGIGAWLSKLPASGRLAKVLSRRTPPIEITDKIKTFGAAFLASQAARALAKGSSGETIAVKRSKDFMERQMSSSVPSNATHIYTMLGEGGALVRRAKEQGLGIVSDVYIALSADEIVRREAMLYPDWYEHPIPPPSQVDARTANKALLECSDIFICPSGFVRDDLINKYGVARDRAFVAPYAVSPSWLSLTVEPEPGRVLFAGSAGLRKGIHILASAAAKLKGECNIHVAGSVSDVVRLHPEAKQLSFLGHLGTHEMASEFAKADVFALPALAEGSASVTAEALGAGIPVVTTKAAGSIVRDGIDGIIVPERDPQALAQALQHIVNDRDRRAEMGRSARARAREFTWDKFAYDVIVATQLAPWAKGH